VERSVPISVSVSERLGFAPLYHPTHTTFRDIAALIARGCIFVCPGQKVRGLREKTGCLLHPRFRVRFAQTTWAHEIRAAGAFRPSRAMDYGYFVLFTGERLFCLSRQ